MSSNEGKAHYAIETKATYFDGEVVDGISAMSYTRLWHTQCGSALQSSNPSSKQSNLLLLLFKLRALLLDFLVGYTLVNGSVGSD